MTFFGFPLEIAVEYLEFVNRGGNSNGKKVVRTRLHAERVPHEPTTITWRWDVVSSHRLWSTAISQRTHLQRSRRNARARRRVLLSLRKTVHASSTISRRITQLCVSSCRWCSHRSFDLSRSRAYSWRTLTLSIIASTCLAPISLHQPIWWDI